MNGGTISVGMLGLMLLSKDQHGDVEFCKIKDSKFGKRVQRETVEELERYHRRLSGVDTPSDSLGIESIDREYFRQLAQQEADNIKYYTDRYILRLKTVGVYRMLDDGNLYLWTEIDKLLESYLRLYTYYDLAYDEGIFLSEMKDMVEDIRGGIF